MKSLVIVVFGFSVLMTVQPTVIDIISKDNLSQAAVSYEEISFLENKTDDPPRHIVFIPFLVPYKQQNVSNNTCEADDDSFPDFFLTDYQVSHGGVVVVVLIGIYGFTLLAVVCNNYFLPCVEAICEILHLSPDVAAATFMSVATSTPELFTNIIGTFITESDLGIGTIVGSSLFNGLGVAAIGSLAAPHPLQLDWWPVTRDCSIYACAVVVLVIITWDGAIFWYEASVLMLAYVIYFSIMFQNTRISKFMRRKFERKKKTEITPETYQQSADPRLSIISAYGTYIDTTNTPGYEEDHKKAMDKMVEEDKENAHKSLFRRPGGSWLHKCVFYYTWPIQLILKCTMPNPKIYPKLFPITFLMCIVWIGLNSYLVSWMIKIIGSLTKLPDSVLGMTLIAAGACLPESISMTIIARRGEGAFGVSNSLGANSMNILYSLGMPWFFKTIANDATTGAPVLIQSGSIEYTILALIFVAVSLYTTLATNRFRLSKRTGFILITIYITMTVLSVLSETVFFGGQKKC